MSDLRKFIDKAAEQLWDALGPIADEIERAKARSCPKCGGELIADTIDHAYRSYDVLRCVDCPYYVEARKHANGTTVSVGHEPEEAS